MIMRILVLFFTVATIVLSVWSLIGSYKYKSYLTNNYLLSFQLLNLNLTAIFEQGLSNTKRDVIEVAALEQKLFARDAEVLEPTRTIEARAIDIASLLTNANYASAAEAIAAGQTSGLAALASELAVSTDAVAAALATASTADIASDLQDFLLTASVPSSIATLAAELTGDLSSVLESVVENLNASDIGLADMYNLGFWGYCKGSLDGSIEELTELGSFGKQFSNSNVNYTYCLPPKVGYKFDPLTVLKAEILEQVNAYANGLSLATGGLTDELAAELVAVVLSLTYSDLGLPGDLQNDLTLLHNLQVAGFSLILAGACLAFISFVFQMIGLCCSPESTILSCCNFLVLFIVFIVVLVGSALTTGAFVYVRKEVNNAILEYGAKAYLLVQFYAFSWSAAAAALIIVVLSFLGYCCGCFHSGRYARGKYRQRYANDNSNYDMVYDHKY